MRAAARRCRQRGRPGRVRDERDATAARPRACGARATAGRRTVADRALGLAALPAPELVTRAARLRLLGRRPQRLRALARILADRGLRRGYAGAGARAHRGYRAASGRRRVRSVGPGRRDPRRSRRCRDRTVPAAVRPPVRPRFCAIGGCRPIRRATRRPEDLPDGAVLVVGSGAYRLPDRRGTAAR